MELRFHHIGLIVNDIETSVDFYENTLNMKRTTDIIYDPVQRVKYIMLVDNKIDGLAYELIQPVYPDSPSAQWLKRGNTIQHFCYEVDDLQQGIKHFVDNGGYLFVEPVPAVIFDNQLIAFLLTKEKLIIELLEQRRTENENSVPKQLHY